MKANFLKIAGVNSEAEFYQMYPSEEAFFAAHPEAQMMKSGGNAPTNPALWSRAKSMARQKYDVYPSAYANGFASKWYKSHGGGWRKAEYGGMMADGGTPDNPGFNALPQAVQEKIIANLAYGGSAQQAATAIAMKAAGKKPKGYYAEGGTNNPGFQALPEYVQAKILSQMAKGGQMPEEIARARFAAAGNLDKMDDYGYAYGGEHLEMMAEGGIPQRYKNMGFTHVGQKKDGDGKHKWKVLAKKGDKYKVVQGGYRGMDDFSQHHNKQRQDNFWSRMGGRDSAKANDPFSPLYWHKRLGKWQEGGAPALNPYGYTTFPKSMSEETDRSGDLFVLSDKATAMREAQIQADMRKNNYRKANPAMNEEALRAQLAQKYGTMKDGDFFPNDLYNKTGSRYMQVPVASTTTAVASASKPYTGYKKGGSTYSGGVWFQDGGAMISSNPYQTQLSDEEMNRQAQNDFAMTAAMEAQQVIKPLKKKPTLNGMMGSIQDTFMEQYTDPFSVTNMANYTGNIIEGINNQNTMNDAMDKRRQNYSTDSAYTPTAGNSMSRGQYDMYGQMVPNKIGSNLSFTGMNQKYSAGVSRFAEGGMSDFDYIADIVTPVYSADPLEGLRNMMPAPSAPSAAPSAPAADMSTMKPTTPDDVDIRTVIGSKESGNNYGALPKGKDGKLASSAVGKYQFLWNWHKDMIKSVTGIDSKEAFRKNPDAQEKFFDYWNNNILTPVASDIKQRFGPNLSMNDIKQIVHFQGPVGAKKFFATGKYTTDNFGSDPVSYLQKKYQEGGEMEVTQEELNQILKMGGQVEFL